MRLRAKLDGEMCILAAILKIQDGHRLKWTLVVISESFKLENMGYLELKTNLEGKMGILVAFLKTVS